ncbi:MAG: transketolase family protein [Candidatus Zixiibacteriota bacterium]
MSYEDTLHEIFVSDPRFMVLTAENRAAIRTLPERIPEQFLDTGITEQTMVGMAAGLALRHRIPVTHALATFLTMRAFEFVRTDVGIANLPVKLVGAFAGFLSEANGPTHQAVEDVALMRGIPHMNVFCPADEQDMLLGLPVVLKSAAPFYIRYNDLPALVEHEPMVIGKAETFGDGAEVAILTYGMLCRQALQAKEILEGQGVSTRVVNLRTLKPVDESVLLAAARECSLVVTLEDHFQTGGLFSILAEVLLNHQRICRTLPICLKERWFKPARLEDVLEFEGFTGKAISKEILTYLPGEK